MNVGPRPGPTCRSHPPEKALPAVFTVPSAANPAAPPGSPSGILVMGVASLDLLCDGVHVAEAPLERVRGEHGGGTGHVVGGVDDGGRLVNGPGRGDAERYAMGLGEAISALE